MKYKWIGFLYWFAAIVWVDASPTEDPYAGVNASWERFGAVYSRILDNYYASLDQEEVMGAAIQGMLGRLDSYSQYYNEEGLRQLRQDTTGKFAGLGITLAIKDRFPVVISPIEDTPAFRAGLKPGDLIVAIEGQSTLDMDLDTVVNTMRGDPGTKVEISVAHRLEALPRKVEIQREIIRIKSVVLVEKFEGGVGYISMRRTRFSERTSTEVEEAIKSLADVEGLILDLRGNPGGLLSQAIQVADLFLPKGVPIVSVKEREGRREEIKRSKRRPVAGEIPLVILIDESSASASEIVAGAIQDNDRGVVVGARSFGKGSVQTIFDLHEVASSALKLTTALYYTPSGRSIHRELGTVGGVRRVLLGDRDFPPLLLMDLILRSGDTEDALSAIQAHFDIKEDLANQILSTRLSDLVGKVVTQKESDLADSLLDRAYYTQKGRKVFGGGGIEPDIGVELEPVPTYIRDLDRRRLFFDFAVDYAAADSSWVESHPDLAVSDEMVVRFMEFVRTKDGAENQVEAGLSEIEAFEALAEDRGWGGAVQESIRQLRVSMEKERDNPLNNKLTPHIKRILRQELVLRFTGRKAQLREELQQDQQLAKAIEILSDEDQYLKVLVKGGNE